MKEHLQSISTVEIHFLSPVEAFGIVRVIGFQHPSDTSSQGQELKPGTVPWFPYKKSSILVLGQHLSRPGKAQNNWKMHAQDAFTDV